jgi:hypothetical protein
MAYVFRKRHEGVHPVRIMRAIRTLAKQSKHSKVARDAFLYMEGNVADFAQCSSCYHFAANDKRCALFGDDIEIDADDTCGLYTQGKYDGHSIKARVTPEEADYAKNTQVRCENCRYGGKDCGLYVALNEQMPDHFKLDTKIKAKACCNAWSKA